MISTYIALTEYINFYLSFSLAYTHALTHTHPISLSLSLPHTYTHIQTHPLSLSLSLPQIQLKKDAVDWLLGSEEGRAGVREKIIVLKQHYSSRSMSYSTAGIEMEAKVFIKSQRFLIFILFYRILIVFYVVLIAFNCILIFSPSLTFPSFSYSSTFAFSF